MKDIKSVNFRHSTKLCVIGTSNGVLKDSYIAALKSDDFFSCVDNYSIGFCSSHLFTYQKNNIDFSSYDICLLELACNDASLLNNGQTGVDIIYSSLLDAVIHIRESGCFPVFLNLPIEPTFGKCDEICNIYEKLSRDIKVPFFDGYVFFRKIFSINTEIEMKHIFRDYMHLNSLAGHGIGKFFVASLKKILNLNSLQYVEIPISFRRQASFLVDSSIFEDAVIRHNLILVSRSTSLLSALVLDFSEDIGADIVCADEFDLVAIAFDFSHCFGTLSISGMKNQRIQFLGQQFSGNYHRLDFGIWPIYPPIGTLSGRLRLNILSPTSTFDVVVSGKSNVAIIPTCISIVSVILRSCPELVIMRAWIPGVFYLHTLCEDQDILEFSSSLLAAQQVE